MNKEFLIELEACIKRYKFWGHHYFILNDYFNGVGAVISIIMPFGFATLFYLPKENTSGINLVLLVLSAIGLILTIVRSLFKFPERAKFHLNQLDQCEELKVKILANLIELEEAAKILIQIKKNDKNEPLP